MRPLQGVVVVPQRQRILRTPGGASDQTNVLLKPDTRPKMMPVTFRGGLPTLEKKVSFSSSVASIETIPEWGQSASLLCKHQRRLLSTRRSICPHSGMISNSSKGDDEARSSFRILKQIDLLATPSHLKNSNFRAPRTMMQLHTICNNHAFRLSVSHFSSFSRISSCSRKFFNGCLVRARNTLL
jgi:hypothetical protein